MIHLSCFVVFTTYLRGMSSQVGKDIEVDSNLVAFAC